MNQGVVLFAVGFKFKRILILIIVAIFIVLSLPIAAVFSLDMPTLSWLANTPDAKAAETQGFYSGPPMPDNTYAWGNCTWWSYAMRKWASSPIPTTWGNANTWDDRAAADGYVVNHTPAIGAIFQTDVGGGGYGHVAYVIKVNSINGDWTISEMNAPTLNVVAQRTFSKEAAEHYTFIHNKTGAQPWTPNPITSMPPYGTGLQP
ncbi:MAG TPA: CHAP domain-containing protein [Candidatus Saccharibacteria bacterium]|nr:CHAP domain-containing protein [Candidatus Saccharibacteria bacterium]